jgi:hypothetical protein
VGKRRQPSLAECVAMMRSRNALRAEEGFHALLPRAKEHVRELMEAFGVEEHHGVRCWILELIGEARAEEAFELLRQQTDCGDEALQDWAVQGLRKLDSHNARKFLFERGLR